MRRWSCDSSHGIELLSQRDVFMIRPIPQWISSKCDVSTLIIPQRSLLVSSRGQFSQGSLFARVESSEHGFAGKAVTEDIVRLVPQPDSFAIAYAFLSSALGYRLLRSVAYGTSIPGMRLDLMRDLPFPELDRELSRQVEGHIEEAAIRRTTADKAEAEAVRILEDEVLPVWLN